MKTAAATKPVRVLVVDDSSLVREMLTAIIGEESDLQVVGEAADGRQAVNLALALQPDLITMDIEMPVLGGFEAIERIMAERPTPILVVTAQTGVRTAFAAISKGALDVVEKPDISLANAASLVAKIRLLARVDLKERWAVGGLKPIAPAAPPAGAGSNGAAIVAIAASIGGPQAIRSILAVLPAAFPLPIVIAQHNADGFAQGMADWLAGETGLKVELARSGQTLAAGHVYLNPSENSMHITADGHIILAGKVPGQTYSPSCDALLSSVAAAYRERALGVILSGMGDDGALGMQAIKRQGGSTIAQDEASSLVYGMNQRAVQRGCIDRVLPLGEIPAELLRRAGGR